LPLVLQSAMPPPVTNGTPLALYEQIIDPSHTGTLEGLRQLSRQTHLHVLLLGLDEELLDVYEFKNDFGIERLVPVSEKACGTHVDMDFDAARTNTTAFMI
jgi:hypothetical protein